MGAAGDRNFVLRGRGGRLLLDLHPGVFIATSVLIGLVVILALIFRAELAASIEALQTQVGDRAGWFLVLTVNVVLGYVLVLFASRHGAVRLGGEGARPDFGWGAWLAMLFSAGMGIGLLFYGVAEPLYHFAEPPHGAAPRSAAAYEDAMTTTFLHWGLHAWAVYALTGLALAYFSYNRGMPLSIRSAFEPLLGDRVNRWPGHAIDTIACVATLFGVATSLGIGAQQINAGIEHLFGVPIRTSTQIALIVGITFVATCSVVLGLDRGIRRLSVINIWIAALLLAFVLVFGPTLFLLNGLVENVGLYLNDLLRLSFWNETYTQGSWQNSWTVFYWGWWIAWSPFVGMFLARISRGRTIREFIAGALFAATGMTFVWLSVFGGAAIYIEAAGAGGLIAAAGQGLERSLFLFLETLPAVGGIDFPALLSSVVGTIAVLSIVMFFVTSSDSGSLVIDIITAGGKARPPAAQRVYWASLEGLVAAVLVVGGGLATLQTAAVAAGLPFSVLLLLMIAGLHRALKAAENSG